MTFKPKRGDNHVTWSVVMPVLMNDKMEHWSKELDITKSELVRQMIGHCINDLENQKLDELKEAK